MCQFKSGIAVKLNESEVQVYTLLCNDRHTQIREQHGIKENGLGLLSNNSTPIELVPQSKTIKLNDPDDWKFVFDAGRPGWWTDGMTEQATRQLLQAAKADIEMAKKDPMKAVKQDGCALRYIKNPSEAVQLASVKQDGYDLRFIKKPSEKVQLAAVNQNGYAVDYIKKPSDKVQLFAVKQYGYAIQYIKKPSEAVQLAAVKKDGNAIQFIKKPSDKVQLVAVKQRGNAIQYIKKPSEAVQLAAKR